LDALEKVKAVSEAECTKLSAQVQLLIEGKENLAHQAGFLVSLSFVQFYHSLYD
jgi:hypothetical protein